MSLYAIGDLHLSFGTDKPMDIFGGGWENYTEKILEGFSTLSENDVCVICGDISWGADLKGAEQDFLFIDRLPGKKIILKGNHDYWWTTASKIEKFFEGAGINTINILHNNCIFYGDNAICGTRGWFYDEGDGSDHDLKIMLREIGRLETSFKAAGDREKLAFLHYPPKYASYICEEIFELFEKYGVKLCCYGHIHGKGRKMAFEGEYRGTRLKMISADHVAFSPVKLLD